MGWFREGDESFVPRRTDSFLLRTQISIQEHGSTQEFVCTTPSYKVIRLTHTESNSALGVLEGAIGLDSRVLPNVKDQHAFKGAGGLDDPLQCIRMGVSSLEAAGEYLAMVLLYLSLSGNWSMGKDMRGIRMK